MTSIDFLNLVTPYRLVYGGQDILRGPLVRLSFILPVFTDLLLPVISPKPVLDPILTSLGLDPFSTIFTFLYLSILFTILGPRTVPRAPSSTSDPFYKLSLQTCLLDPLYQTPICDFPNGNGYDSNSMDNF